jgi:GNAT superfamily N-acetyltransferase
MRSTNGIVARRAELGEIFQVRWDVLRPNRPREAACFPLDDAPETIHVGAFEAERNVGCATATRVDWQGQPAWQLRGMGIAKDVRGRGVGAMMLAELEGLVVAAAPIRLMWCNAREEAVGFYEKQGWEIASEKFMIEDVGPHFKMTRQLGA